MRGCVGGYFFFYKKEAAWELGVGLVGWEMCRGEGGGGGIS